MLYVLFSIMFTQELFFRGYNVIFSQRFCVLQYKNVSLHLYSFPVCFFFNWNIRYKLLFVIYIGNDKGLCCHTGNWLGLFRVTHYWPTVIHVDKKKYLNIFSADAESNKFKSVGNISFMYRPLYYNSDLVGNFTSLLSRAYIHKYCYWQPRYRSMMFIFIWLSGVTYISQLLPRLCL